MPRITAIVPDGRRPGRFAVVVDGQTADAAVVGIDGVERLALRVGRDVTERLAADLADENAAVRVYDRAVRLLAVRARSAADLRRRLTRADGAGGRGGRGSAGADPRHVSLALDRLAAAGLVDDAEYARTRVRSRLRVQGSSARRLKQELARDGVAADVAADAVAEVFEDEAVDVTAIVEQLARRRARMLSGSGLDPIVIRRRLYAFLARRGYGPDDVRRAVDAALDRASDEVPE